MKFFSFPVFLISFTLGILIVYATSPPPREIMVYPSLDNVGDLLYKDNANQCYSFIPKEVSCPKDETMIKKVLPQISKL